jgi:16S rRNA (guanine527-N7)-methyltransferase
VTFSNEIRVGTRALGIPLSDQQGDILVDYLNLLKKWNKVFSLTSVPEKDWAKLHILDSLSVLPHLAGKTLADVGSGPGFPGIPLALLRPDWSVTLIERNEKKVSFLTQAVLELQMPNVKIYPGGVEDFPSAATFDIVISRAFAQLDKFVRLAGHLCGYSGTLAAMKADISQTELDQLDGAFQVEKIISLAHVDPSLKRTLIIMKQPRISISSNQN